MTLREENDERLLRRMIADGRVVFPEPGRKTVSPSVRLQRAQDAVDDAQAELGTVTGRGRAAAVGFTAGCVATVLGAVLMWFGLWGIALPFLIIGGVVEIVSGIGTVIYVVDPDREKLGAQRKLRTAERDLRDALTGWAGDES